MDYERLHGNGSFIYLTYSSRSSAVPEKCGVLWKLGDYSVVASGVIQTTPAGHQGNQEYVRLSATADHAAPSLGFHTTPLIGYTHRPHCDARGDSRSVCLRSICSSGDLAPK